MTIAEQIASLSEQTVNQEQYDVLSEEDKVLYELSDATLKTYKKKAEADKASFDKTANTTSVPQNVEVAKAVSAARSKGIEKASAKLNKEDLEISMQEDIAALVQGEDLSEEFKAKAATIFEAAVVTRVKAEVAKLDEAFEAQLAEEVAVIKTGLEEQVDGYLDYFAEQWITQNELALTRGMKTEIVEGFISGLQGLFKEHYIEVPEEKLDVMGSLEEKVKSLESDLNEQINVNVTQAKALAQKHRVEIVNQFSEGLAATEVEKFLGLTEELSYESADAFKTKVQTIRENYFAKSATTTVAPIVTDTPPSALTEETKVDPAPMTLDDALKFLNK